MAPLFIFPCMPACTAAPLRGSISSCGRGLAREPATWLLAPAAELLYAMHPRRHPFPPPPLILRLLDVGIRMQGETKRRCPSAFVRRQHAPRHWPAGLLRAIAAGKTWYRLRLCNAIRLVMYARTDLLLPSQFPHLGGLESRNGGPATSYRASLVYRGRAGLAKLA